MKWRQAKKIVEMWAENDWILHWRWDTVMKALILYNKKKGAVMLNPEAFPSFYIEDLISDIITGRVGISDTTIPNPYLAVDTHIGPLVK